MTPELQEKMLRFIDAHEEDMIALWRKLVLIESPSHYKAGVDGVGQVLAEFCTQRLGYHLRWLEDETYGNCLAACSCPFAPATWRPFPVYRSMVQFYQPQFTFSTRPSVMDL